MTELYGLSRRRDKECLVACVLRKTIRMDKLFRAPPFSDGWRMLDEPVSGMGNWELDERGKNGKGK